MCVLKNMVNIHTFFPSVQFKSIKGEKEELYSRYV